MYELLIKTTFDAAHRLCGYQGDCSRVHGHTWTVEVAVSGGRLNSIGMLMDFKDLKKIVKKTIDELDHNYINQLPAFAGGKEESNPTAENLSRYIYNRVKNEINKSYPEIKLSRVKVWESPSACAIYWED
ncbi:6-pyruvoyltetrahydropterin/6-carboxytetrahydropterin synthase [Desulfohalotomaculum tongense]|uniref:6-carboxytetrahydropterin synthase QueD n=1 Tax=Desulforadius tongensis TaxID=1216062 RepID=UPI0019581AF3|nr:6-carboxytetrahydropterin synthase QueD [Desulforadius tongensis]MBM7855288.1 6-pyruvoyltetrahydropterin/6-carboxytetrahydropterin synthase [Desulforadius tongensis]